MYVLTKKQIRPDVSVEFFDIRNSDLVTKEYRDYWRATYIATSKCLFVQHSLSPDQLEMTSVMMWSTKADYDAFVADQTSLDEFLNKFTEYNTTNNITTELVSEEDF